MSSYPVVTLKPGKDIPVRGGHPWVFSEAIAQDANGEPGMLVELQAYNGVPLGIGTWNSHSSIRVRLLTHRIDEKIDEAFFIHRLAQLHTWKTSRLPKQTTGYRLVHAEADGIPGLIIDRFANCYVFQLHTAGTELLRETIIKSLHAFHQSISSDPCTIVERSDLDVRRQEGLHTQPIEVHQGEISNPILFQEDGITFSADVLKGQKTGFFLDQREARIRLQSYAKGKRVMNLFGYTGAFSLHAAKAGAAFVNTVDISHAALEIAEQQFTQNGYDTTNEERMSFLEADVFDLMEEKSLPQGPYDILICDPPALTKDARHLPQAIKAYTYLNERCLDHLQPGGILVTSSCSGRLTPEDFRSLLRIAAGRAKRDIRLLDWITQPIDHAERLAFPEGRYLKTAFLEVTGLL